MVSLYNTTLNSTVKQPQNMDQNSLITAHKRSLGQGNVFTPVCHSVHRTDLPHYKLGYIHPLFGQTTAALGRHQPSILRDTVNKPAVRILLECKLVSWILFMKNLAEYRAQAELVPTGNSGTTPYNPFGNVPWRNTHPYKVWFQTSKSPAVDSSTWSRCWSLLCVRALKLEGERKVRNSQKSWHITGTMSRYVFSSVHTPFFTKYILANMILRYGNSKQPFFRILNTAPSHPLLQIETETKKKLRT